MPDQGRDGEDCSHQGFLRELPPAGLKGAPACAVRIAPHLGKPGLPDTRQLSSGHMGRGLAQTSAALQCSERTLRRYVREGLLHADEREAREVRLPIDEEIYLREHWSVLRGLRRALRTEQGVRLAVLFGSQATGEDRPDSDVDLLVELNGRDLRRQMALQRRLTRALGRRVHLVALEDAAKSPSMLTDILSEGRVIVDRAERWPALQRTRSRVMAAAEREDHELLEQAREAIAAARERVAD